MEERPHEIEYEGTTAERRTRLVKTVAGYYAASCVGAFVGILVADLIQVCWGRRSVITHLPQLVVMCSLLFPITLYWVPLIWYLAWEKRVFLQAAVVVITITSGLVFSWMFEIIASMW